MKKFKIMSIILTVCCTAALITGCGGAGTSDGGEKVSDHPVITMNAPYRNMSVFADLVHEKYPEINLEIIPYNGQNMSNYMKNMRLSGEMTDIYFTTYYSPGQYDDAKDFIDLSAYDFTGNFTQSRLREVTVDGGVYMLPLGYNALGITYNKTLFEKNGWDLPKDLDDLEALKVKAEAAGYTFCRDQLQYPGYGFQYLCNIADTGFLSTVDGIKWQEDFINGKANVSDTPQMKETLQLLQRWRDIGMLNGDGTPDDDRSTKEAMAEGNTLFLIGNSNDIATETDTEDTFSLMPYLSEDGEQNVFILNVSRYAGINKDLSKEENSQKLEDAIHVMELLSTVEGMESLEPTQNNSRLLPLKDASVDDGSYYADVLEDLDTGHTANFIYSGWENILVVLGEKMIDFTCGNASLDDVIKCFDENQHLITDDEVTYYTTVTKTIDTEDCARLVGICFAQATGADAALVSVNKWNYDLTSTEMNKYGVSGCLFPVPVSDQEIVSILPTGWRDDIQTVTLTGARIKELAKTGYDMYGNGNTFPYVFVTKDGAELDDNKEYTIPVCGATDDVQKEGNIQDSGVIGLDAAKEYLSQFETLSPDDIVWE